MAMISRECLSLAAEYAVASELCRRNVYAQLTLGTRKRTDILVETGRGSVLKIEVKGKQGPSWPNCIGICGQDTMMVLVDFAHKGDADRPEFYILTADDWHSFLNTALQAEIASGKVLINEDNIPVWPREVKYGQPYKGCGIKPSQVVAYKERWESVTGQS